MDMTDSVRAKISDEEKTSAVPDAEPYDLQKISFQDISRIDNNFDTDNIYKYFPN